MTKHAFEHRGNGSPPRLRGILPAGERAIGNLRFTPAPAGNTEHPASPDWGTTVHPRACGEYFWRGLIRLRPLGSPPRLRGIHDRRRTGGHRGRFTPAPAGNTCQRIVDAYYRSVHPRACGEYRVSRLRGRPVGGSPPRLRGIRDSPPRAFASRRFTPAPAGNTRGSRSPSPPRPVHPRACGEYKRATSHPTCSGGSPPRLRGILQAR